MTDFRLRSLTSLFVVLYVLAAGYIELRAETVINVKPKSEILAWAVAQQPLESEGAKVQLFPLGFSKSGRFATLKKLGYRGECSEEECPSGFYLVVYDLVTDKLLDELWVDELVSGKRVRESGGDPDDGLEFPVVTPADVDRLLRKYKIESKAFRIAKTGAGGIFTVRGTQFRLEDRSPCLVDDNEDEPDGCQDEVPYETVLTKVGTGSKVITGFTVWAMWLQHRMGFVVINQDGTRIAIAYETVQYHEGLRIVDCIIVGAHLGTRFKKTR